MNEFERMVLERIAEATTGEGRGLTAKGLMADLACSHQKVIRALHRLEAAGHIELLPTFDEVTGLLCGRGWFFVTRGGETPPAESDRLP
jgi:hypothetical protein